MAEILRLEEQFAIVSAAERPATPSRVLKQGDAFAVFDTHGDVVPGPGSEHGFYFAGTRFLSRFELLLGQRQPLLLSSTISDDNVVFTADLTNPDLFKDGRVRLPRGILHLFRTRMLLDGCWLECVRVSNYGLEPLETPLTFQFDADFADVFEVRGTQRAARGERLPGTSGDESVLRYQGLDGVERRTRIRSLRAADRTTRWGADLLPAARAAQLRRDRAWRGVRGTPADACHAPLHRLGERRAAAGHSARWRRLHHPQLERRLQPLAATVHRGPADDDHRDAVRPISVRGHPMVQHPVRPRRPDHGVRAAVGWPDVARGVLSFLAETQATAVNDASDAQPGKILHEMREGEMAALGEIPFGRYYGTPMPRRSLSCSRPPTSNAPATWRSSNASGRTSWRRSNWLDRHGDVDGDGFIEYARRSETGLIQQGWKDSWDSVFHADGSLAEPPIALCEVQAYAFAAWSGAARLADARGDHEQAEPGVNEP